jgi:predicted O-methyltransferase YrrM
VGPEVRKLLGLLVRLAQATRVLELGKSTGDGLTVSLKLHE